MAPIQPCCRTQKLPSTLPVPYPVRWPDAAFPTSPLQPRFESCRYAIHRTRPPEHPTGPTLSLCPFFPYLFAHPRQSTAAFAEVEVALPSRVFGTSARPNRLLSQGWFPSHGKIGRAT